jgi:hypothetical protein
MGVKQKFVLSATQVEARQAKAVERTEEQLDDAALDERLPDRSKIEVVYVNRPYRPLAYEVRRYKPGNFAALLLAPEDAQRDIKAAIVVSDAGPVEKEKELRVLSAREIARREGTQHECRPHSGMHPRFAGGYR